jgi:nicotinamidase-related amidase
MKKMLLVVDPLNAFFDPDGELNFEAARKIVPEINHIIGLFQKTYDPVVFLCDSHNENDREFEIHPPHAITGTWSAEIYPEINSNNIIYIAKKRYSGFFNTSLDSIIKIEEPEVTHVIGVCTSICVMDTVGDLANRDIPTIVNSKAVADFDPQMHEFALTRMKNIYGTMII